MSESSPPEKQMLRPSEMAEPYGRWVTTTFRHNPTLLLTVGYVFLTLCGMAYDIWFLDKFGVRILDYADVQDFLLAGLREPMVVLLSLVSVITIWLVYQWDHFARNQFALYRKAQIKVWTAKPTWQKLSQRRRGRAQNLRRVRPFPFQ